MNCSGNRSVRGVQYFPTRSGSPFCPNIYDLPGLFRRGTTPSSLHCHWKTLRVLHVVYIRCIPMICHRITTGKPFVFYVLYMHSLYTYYRPSHYHWKTLRVYTCYIHSLYTYYRPSHYHWKTIRVLHAIYTFVVYLL